MLRPIYELSPSIRVSRIEKHLVVEVKRDTHILEGQADPSDLMEIILTLFERELLGEPDGYTVNILEKLVSASKYWVDNAEQRFKEQLEKLADTAYFARLDPNRLNTEASKIMEGICGKPECTNYKCKDKTECMLLQKAETLRKMALKSALAKGRLEEEKGKTVEAAKRLAQAKLLNKLLELVYSIAVGKHDVNTVQSALESIKKEYVETLSKLNEEIEKTVMGDDK